MRGFLGGVSLGAIVAITGAAFVSLAVPLPQTVETSALRAPRDPGAVPPGVTPETAVGRDADLVEAVPAAPDTPVQTTENSGDAPVAADTTPGQLPDAETDVGADPLTALVEDKALPEVETVVDDAVTAGNLSLETSAALSEPAAEGEPEVTTTPAALPESPAADGVADVAELPVPSDQSAQPALESGESPKPAQADAPVTPSLPVAEAAPTGVEAAVPASRTVTLPRVGEDTPAAPDAPPVPEETQDSRLARLPQANVDTTSGGPSVGNRVLPLTERQKSASLTTQISNSAGQDDLPPFERYAVMADPIDDLPYMSIVLIESETAVGAEALSAFPYPLTFAIDPSDPKAAQRIAERRAAGFEVMILANLPRGATPQDAETALPIWFERMSGAMGVLEGVESGVQGNRPLADQVAAIVGEAGYGLVLQNNGLNTVQKLAARDGTPSGVVFRDFDGAGQDPRAIRRFLDQAAFRAGQEGAVIMLGRLKPDTISALLLWGLQDRASRVALVPTSASLKLLQEK